MTRDVETTGEGRGRSFTGVLTRGGGVDSAAIKIKPSPPTASPGTRVSPHWLVRIHLVILASLKCIYGESAAGRAEGGVSAPGTRALDRERHGPARAPARQRLSRLTATQPFIGQPCTAPPLSQACSGPLGDSLGDRRPLPAGGTLHSAGRRGEKKINKLENCEAVISAVQGIKTSCCRGK